MSDPWPLHLKTPLGDDYFHVLKLRCESGLSLLPRCELELLTPRGAEVPFEAILGAPAFASMGHEKGRERTFPGIIAELRVGAGDERFDHYQAILVPPFWLLTQGRQYRIFQHQSTRDILESVFAAVGQPPRFGLGRELRTRNFCVQYGETDFDFLNRLMEDEGIFWYHDHDSQLVITDRVDAVSSVSNLDSVPFRGGATAESTRVVRSFHKAQQLRIGHFALRDHCFELMKPTGSPQTLEHLSSLTPQPVMVGTASHRLIAAGAGDYPREDYIYPGGFARHHDAIGPQGNEQAEELARIGAEGHDRAVLHAQREAVAAFRIEGESNVGDFNPGSRFRLKDHGPGDGEYYLIHVVHEAAQNPPVSADAVGFSYANRFAVLPAGLPYRPGLRAPRPRIAGVQTATVVGPRPPEQTPWTEQTAHTDKYGRVKIKFHWDRDESFASDRSCWVRVAQTWAGKRYGAFFWPRPGHEVVVAFEDGDPDRPLITGSVYNDANMPPFDLPRAVDTAGFKSCSEGMNSSTDFNGLCFHDSPGDEHVQIHSRHQTVETNNTYRFSITPGSSFEVVGSVPMVGSGSGGGLLDWMTAWPAKSDRGAWWNLPHHLPGKVEYVAGTRLASTWFGNRYTNVLGGVESKTAASLEALLSSAFPALSPFKAMFQMSGGTSGQLDMILGDKVTWIAAGRKFDVMHGGKLEYKANAFLAPHDLGRLPAAQGGGRIALEGQAAYNQAAKVLAVLIYIATMTLDTLAILTAATDSHGKDSYSPWYSSFAPAVLNRAQALMMIFEEVCATTYNAQNGVTDLKEQLKAYAAGIIFPLGLGFALAKSGEHFLEWYQARARERQQREMREAAEALAALADIAQRGSRAAAL